ncbi:bacteriocin [Sinomicrobium weinanense]|uniref:Bacteriocin n=1 Tax=Sinomicrobium weinanense TaxID=2842200 RepID=A0A926Q1T4_9FLAO|nr:bacteriocin [Sinomicrobium weinanense]MBC9795893.1 bacteriocin [Sinomicrobium weinanense]MBU3124728.1 bacteriocin [Sinomicrobium weinanense]
MKHLNKYGVEELNENELSNINGGLNIDGILEVLNGIVSIVTAHMDAALDAVRDFISDFLGGING